MRVRVAVVLTALALAPLPARAQGTDQPPAGETISGPGVTLTVQEIMARDAALVPEPFRVRITKEEHPVPHPLFTNPDSPLVGSWPPPAAGTPGAPSLLEEPRSPQPVGTSFLGARLADAQFVPPDSMGDVGPSQVMVVVNGRIRVFDKAGTLGPLNTTTDNFFGSVAGGHGTSDPHVRYDRLSRRWFVSIINVNVCPNDVLLAVSSGSVITSQSSFTFFRFQAESGAFLDYDTLGVDRFALYIGGNMFLCTGPFKNTSVFVVNKANLMSGTLSVTAFRGLIGGSAGMITPQGVSNDDPGASEGYFVGADAFAFGLLVLHRVTNPGGAPVLSSRMLLTVPVTSLPIEQVQPSGPTLDALDDRLFAAQVHTNAITGQRTLWAAHNIEVDASGAGGSGGGRNGSRWYEIGGLTGTPALVQAGTLFDNAAAPFGYWIPSVAMSRQGHMALVAGRAGPLSPSGFASIAVAGRLRTDALGSTQTPTLAQGSSTPYDTILPDVPERWGDYSQVGVDPNDGQTMWAFQEYCDATNSWGVRAIQLRAPPPAAPVTASPASIPPGQPSVNVVVNGSTAGGAEFFDPGPDSGGPGFPNRIQAAVAPSVTVNSIVFNGPSQVTLNVSTVGSTVGAKNVTITNPDGQARTGAGILTVACPVITVNPATIPGGFSGVPYFQAFTQTGGIAPVTFSLVGPIPAGMSFTANGAVLSGIPTQTGSFTFQVRVVDAAGCTGSRDYTLVISCPTLTVNPATVPTAFLGGAYSVTFDQSGGLNPSTFSLTGMLPTGITFNAATATLSGAATQSGSFPFTIHVTDAAGCTGSRDYTLVVTCPPLAVNPLTLPTGKVGSAYTQPFTVSGNTTAVTFAQSGTLPTGLAFQASPPRLSGTPTQSGAFLITVGVTDTFNCTASRAYNLAVAGAADLVPAALSVDAAGNRVLEANETAVVAPSWTNQTGSSVDLTGALSSFIGPPGPSAYTIVDGAATYGTIADGATGTCSTGGNCYSVSIAATARPETHWDASVVESLNTGGPKAWTLHVGGSFTDVPSSSPFYRFVEILLHRGITTGCGGSTYCPLSATTREAMAVFVLVAKEGAGYVPPACGTPVFNDVPASSPFCRWIEELVRRGVTTGCGGGNYCPANPVTREQMSVFVLRTLDPALDPPACGTPVFGDVPASSPFCRWIEELVRRGVVNGCGGGNYCPSNPVTREQMGVFVSATFGLTLYGP